MRSTFYIRIKEGKIEVSEPLSDDIIVDLDERGEVIGIEILLPKSEIVRKNFPPPNPLRKAR
ncbi:MAG: DUF2283 domain-containing protein [Archaeoglobaceae archaeon]